jgi:hypothetical protein
MGISLNFQLDRKDPMRHYTKDNVRWLNKSYNIANKPSSNTQSKSDFSKWKGQLKHFYNIERSQYVLTEMLGALTKGYGISESGVPSSAWILLQNESGKEGG